MTTNTAAALATANFIFPCLGLTSEILMPRIIPSHPSDCHMKMGNEVYNGKCSRKIVVAILPLCIENTVRNKSYPTVIPDSSSATPKRISGFDNEPSDVIQ